ncbi:hypothetical protein LSAT2_010464 [Lamellibrachia satsuma]|nr:hypothetical protein LSAT2_010464 [Lamellibrachia satsuma]
MCRGPLASFHFHLPPSISPFGSRLEIDASSSAFWPQLRKQTLYRGGQHGDAAGVAAVAFACVQCCCINVYGMSVGTATPLRVEVETFTKVLKNCRFLVFVDFRWHSVVSRDSPLVCESIFSLLRNKVDWAMEMKPEPGISDTTEDNFNESASNQSTASSHGHCIDEFKSHGHINSTHSPTCSSDGYADTCCIKTEDELTEMLQEGQVYDIAGQSEPGCLSHVRVKLEAEQSDDCSGYGGDTRRWVVDEDGELQEVLKVEATDEAAEAFARQDSINDSDPEELCGVIDAEGNDIDKPRTCFTCSVCGRPFARSSTRNIHERTHTGEKPFTCSTCGKAFTQSGSLKAHERIHTGVKPYSCTTCFRSFVASCDLRRHERIHTGTRPYACASCEPFTTDATNMKQLTTDAERFTTDAEQLTTDAEQRTTDAEQLTTDAE